MQRASDSLSSFYSIQREVLGEEGDDPAGANIRRNSGGFVETVGAPVVVTTDINDNNTTIVRKRRGSNNRIVDAPNQVPNQVVHIVQQQQPVTASVGGTVGDPTTEDEMMGPPLGAPPSSSPSSPPQSPPEQASPGPAEKKPKNAELPEKNSEDVPAEERQESGPREPALEAFEKEKNLAGVNPAPPQIPGKHNDETTARRGSRESAGRGSVGTGISKQSIVVDYNNQQPGGGSRRGSREAPSSRDSLDSRTSRNSRLSRSSGSQDPLSLGVQGELYRGHSIEPVLRCA